METAGAFCLFKTGTETDAKPLLQPLWLATVAIIARGLLVTAPDETTREHAGSHELAGA
jgi:hypothetical protein